jgi:pimeloyl-ACP methyl ester carboxylesterase
MFKVPSISAARGLLAAMLFLSATLACAAPELAPSRFNNGAAVDASPLGNRLPVLLVHGLGGGNEGWENFLRAYEANAAWRAMFKPYSFSYSTTANAVLADASAPRSVNALGGELRTAMQAYYTKPAVAPHFGFAHKRVVILAHSMGGLVARSMMQEHTFADGQRGGEKVLHLITLATPHHGSPLADAALNLGFQTVSEIADTWPGFLADVAWTNHDSLDMSGRRCNSWLAGLNNYAPSQSTTNLGGCGTATATALPGFYERIVAYGARDLQTPDLPLGYGFFKPGSSSSLLPSYGYLRNGLAKPYGNDGIVPIASAQFEGPTLWKRGEAYSCDHRYIRRAYEQTVKTPKTSFTEWAFCSAYAGDTIYSSGRAGGYAIAGSIFGAPGSIIDIVRNAWEAERVFDFAEQAVPDLLQPAGAGTQVAKGYFYRHYAGTQSYVGIHEGSVYYLGPASGNQLHYVGSLAGLLAQAQGAGF